MRTPKEQGSSQEAGVLTPFPALAPATVAEADDGRAMMEATCWQDTQARGHVKRRQHTWDAPHMVVC
jgi:hypothetical protein